MNFTREPIILSVITPKEGCKLIIRNIYMEDQGDFFVDAIEVVSFEGAIFFRSLERPKSFIVPVSSYEILEVKETRMVLKNAPQEKAVKIGGGNSSNVSNNGANKQIEEKKADKMRERKRSKRRKPSSSTPLPLEMPDNLNPVPSEEALKAVEAPQVSSSVLKKIFPPPNTLIKEKLARYKNEEFFEDNIFPLVDQKSKNIEEDIHDKKDEINLPERIVRESSLEEEENTSPFFNDEIREEEEEDDEEESNGKKRFHDDNISGQEYREEKDEDNNLE